MSVPADPVLAADGAARLPALLAAFGRRAGRSPTFVVRAPGRVNLLGEHTDYNGLPVLPMAIDRSILIAGAARADRGLRLFNTAARFSDREFVIGDPIPPYPGGDWGNYSKAAVQGLLRHCGAQLSRGADLLIDGSIPDGAGLSSSSALVVANALALLEANGFPLPRPALAELLAAAERYVGTLSGGMDQAVSLLAQSGHALRVNFFPLRVRPVVLPPGYSIVVCHSLVPALKSGAARLAYNLRVIECRLASRVLERVLGAHLPRSLRTVGDLAALFPHRPLLDFLWPLTAQLPERPLQLAEIAAVVGTSVERLRERCGIAPELGDRFALVRRLRHVLSEAERVNQAVEALAAADAARFGQLMDASHASCRDDYEISCAELETLIQMAKEAGAVGARLTGAGFGGCTVNLVRDSDVVSFRTRLQRNFYHSRRAALAAAGLGDGSFVFRPSQGATVLRL
jgi:N-acetylgalactosamine kinase